MRIAFYLACAFVAVLSLAPSAALPPVSIGDKVEHVIAYAVLGLLGAASARHHVAATILALFVFGSAIEMLQAYSPGRAPDLLDVAANLVGVCLGAVMLRGMTSLLIDKDAAGTTPCRPRAAGGDVQSASDTPAAAPPSPHKRGSCESN